jgi:hypothetical protein
MVCCHFASAQQIKIQPLKKAYHIKRENAYCNIQNLSSDTLYYLIGLDMLKDGHLVTSIKDLYQLIMTKTEPLKQFMILKPKRSVRNDIVRGAINKEKLDEIMFIIHKANINTYDFRFKVIYGNNVNGADTALYSPDGKNTNAVDNVLYSSLFKLRK